jgi:hypothetical protein
LIQKLRHEICKKNHCTNEVFFAKWKQREIEILTFFVKDPHVVGEKKARNGRKTDLISDNNDENIITIPIFPPILMPKIGFF